MRIDVKQAETDEVVRLLLAQHDAQLVDAFLNRERRDDCIGPYKVWGQWYRFNRSIMRLEIYGGSAFHWVSSAYHTYVMHGDATNKHDPNVAAHAAALIAAFPTHSLTPSN